MVGGSGVGSLSTLWQLRRFRNAYLARGVGVWFALRLALGLAAVSNPALIAETGLLALVGVGVLVDARRRFEDLFLANLGVPGWAIATVALPGALVLECLIP